MQAQPTFTLNSMDISVSAARPVTLAWNFSRGAQGWRGGFADLPSRGRDIYELFWGVRSLPPPLIRQNALFIRGANRSDDLFMYFKRPIRGLAPNTDYSVTFNVQLASNEPSGSVGIGGSPANSVYLKAGVTLVEPRIGRFDRQIDLLTLNIDKGNQSQRGRDSVVLGDIAKLDDGNSTTYVLITRNSQNKPFRFRTGQTGTAWLYFGTDSGYEGTTALYYTRFQARFTPIARQAGWVDAIGFLPLLLLGLVAFRRWNILPNLAT